MTAPTPAAEAEQPGGEQPQADTTPAQQTGTRPPPPSSNTPTARHRRTLGRNRW